MNDTKKSRYILENLVVLEYASNNCWTNVRNAKEVLAEMSSSDKEKKEVSGDYHKFSIDLDNGTWNWWKYKEIQIGNSRSTTEHHEKIIGVYDRTNTSHLSGIAHQSIDATKDWSGAD